MGEKQKKILTVDDSTDILDMIKTRLEAADYEVVTAINGLEGFERAVQEVPDLIIMDIKMDQMDGYALLGKIRQNEITKSIPVIMLTGYDGMKDLFDMESISDYIVKPFEVQDLLLRVSRALKEDE